MDPTEIERLHDAIDHAMKRVSDAHDALGRITDELIGARKSLLILRDNLPPRAETLTAYPTELWRLPCGPMA